MIRKEILEIKRQFKPMESTINRICCCYVGGENKNIICKTVDAFHSLPEEECFKYFEIFKKALSGSIGKNLINLEFPLSAEEKDEPQDFLLQLRNSKLKDEDLLEEFFNQIITTYEYTGNYAILLMNSDYDVPGKASDGSTMDDASDEVFSYFLCCICPVELSKPGLGFNEKENRLRNRERDWVVKVPDTAFLFPAFNDRCTDIHACLYYSRDGKNLQSNFVNQMLGCKLPMAAAEQKLSFQNVITDTLGTDCDYETVKTIHENLTEIIEEAQDSEDTLVFSKETVRKLFESSGVDEKLMQNFDTNFDNTIGKNAELVANNLAEKTFEVKTANVVIKVDPEMTHLIETKVVDGRKCLVVEIDGGVEVNGIVVNSHESDSSHG